MNTWLLLSFIVLFILALQDILHRYLMKEGFTAIELVLYGFIPSIIAALIYVYITSIKLRIPTKKHTGIYILSGVLSFVGFLLLRQAQINSPNIGYVSVITYSSVMVTLFLTAYLFKDHLGWEGIVGSLLIICGLGLITSVNHKKV